ncbi:replication initiation protein RepC [Novosphingobium terrae]|uniref:replication initiation protein RepC n=1 Tax=Novosphingobium terrae TaxID=2726189 RepID=UPI001980F2FC|nr:replication initiation protein RepC [Novosphingobium terrae]
MTYTQLLGDLAQRDVRRLREASYAIGERRAFENLKPAENAAEHKRAILHCLDELARHHDNGIGLSRSNVRHLAGLVRATRAEDIRAHGGLIGGANDWYGAKLGVLPATMTTIFRALKRAGLILPHNETGNHRRSSRRGTDGSYSGRGYSLLPLTTRLSELQSQADRLKRDALAFHAASADLRRLLRQINAHLRLVPDPVLVEQLSLIQTSTARIKRIDQLPRLLDLHRLTAPLLTAAQNAVENVGKSCANHAPTRDQSEQESRQHHTVEQPSFCRVATAQSIRPDNFADFAQESARANQSSVQPGANELTCRITVAEARDLFAQCKDDLPASFDHEGLAIATGTLASSMLISSKLIASAIETMGLARTFWSLVLVRHRSKNHEIHRSPGAYFHGMVAKAHKGQLNLDGSIWALRQIHQARAT